MCPARVRGSRSAHNRSLATLIAYRAKGTADVVIAAVLAA